MAISPYRVSILRGVNAMARGVKNPYGKPQLGAAPEGNSKLAPNQRGPQPRPGKKKDEKINNQFKPAPPPGLKVQPPQSAGTTPKAFVQKPKPGVAPPKAYVTPKNSETTFSKTAAAQNTAVGKKTYGQSGRTAPNIGPTSASGSVGYKQRSMRQAAAKAAAENLRQKRLKNG